MKIRLYWHIWLTNHWRRIVCEQLEIIKNSGLFDSLTSRSINFSFSGSYKELIEAERLLTYPTLIKVAGSRWIAGNNYEFPAIEAVFDYSKSHARFIAFYIHTKGVSYPDDRHANWRDILNEGVITKWREHVNAIENGAQVSGQNYMAPNDHRTEGYFSGNFWAADSRYIATLADPRTLDQTNRYEAERWICSGNPKVNALPFIEPNP